MFELFKLGFVGEVEDFKFGFVGLFEMFKLGFIEEIEVKFCRDRRPRRSTPHGFGDHKPSVNGPSGTPVPTRRVPHGGCSVSTNTPINPNLNVKTLC